MARTVQNFIRNKKLQKQQKLLQQEQDADTDDEQPANKRQKKAISKQTTKRRQSKDEKKEKQTANKGRQEALQLENPNRKPCPTCIAAGRHELAKTHSRSSSNLCPDQKKRQKVKNEELSGAPLRTHTIKHGLYGLLLDMTDDEKTQFVQGVETVVDFNRQLVIKGHLFLLYFFTYRLDAGLPLLSCFFQQAFFYGIFQLLLGGKFTNQSTFDAATRDNINFVFRRFIQQFPLARCEKVSSPIGRSPIAFSGILSSTAQTYSTHLLSHVVENFDGFYIAYLQGRLRRMIPELAQNHAMHFAHFVYQSTVNDDKFPPVWPEIEYDPAIDDKLNESLLTIMDEASTEWNNIHELITTEEARRRSVQASRGSSIASSSTDPLPESMDIPSPASSVGSIGMTQLDLETPNPVHSAKSITTATISSYPEFFLPVMFDILRKMEQWNQIDSELPAIPQNEAKRMWTYHLLSGLPEWTRLDHRRRSSLTRAITNIINEGVRFIPEKLPAGFSAESIMHIQNAITTAQTEIREGRFAPPVYLTKQQARLFTIIPIPGLTRKYIHIDHQSLGTILKHFGLGRLASPSSTPIPPNQPHPNFNMFDLRKLKRHGIFENSFTTDGYATSFPFKKIVNQDRLPSLSIDDITSEDMQECKVWGVDPGVTEVFVAVDNSDPSERHQVRKFSSAEYYVKAGYKKTNNTICETKQSQNIDRLESSIPSPKTSSMDGIQLYIERLLDVLPLLVQFYGTEIQRLRFLNYIGKQKVQDERINIFVNGGKKYNPDPDHHPSEAVVMARTRTDGTTRRKRRRPPPPSSFDDQLPPSSSDEQPPSTAKESKLNKWKKLPFSQTPSNITTVVCVGDGSFGRRMFRGKIHGLANIFRKLLRKAEQQGRLIVANIDEYLTSQVCSKCGTKSLENIKVGESKLHAVQSCTSCGRLWQRDHNAARNIYSLAMNYITTGSRPSVFSRLQQ